MELKQDKMGFFDFLGFGKGPNISEVSEELNESTPTNEITLPQRDTIPVGNYEIGSLYGTNGFNGLEFDSFAMSNGVFGYSSNDQNLFLAKDYILKQRNIAFYPDVFIGIEEIMKDLYIKDDFLFLEANLDNEDYDKVKKLYDRFKKHPIHVPGNLNLVVENAMFNFIKQGYIDGVLNVYAFEIEEEDVQDLFNIDDNPFGFGERFLNEEFERKKDIRIDLLEAKSDKPKKKYLHFIPIDPTKIGYTKQFDKRKMYYSMPNSRNNIELDEDRLITVDFGLFDPLGVKHGYLWHCFKTANQLESLQDMLIPMRFRRSIARRVFNIDVGNLPQSRADSYMRELQAKFKYRKKYNANSGKIEAENGVMNSIVEDYYFANRSGSKGTEVTTIDESSNFQDGLSDIMYFRRKLYQSMMLPTRRVFNHDGSDQESDFTNHSIDIEEERFYNFLHRVRSVYDVLFTEMFRRVMKYEGFEARDCDKVKVFLNYNNEFEKTKNQQRFIDGVSTYNELKPFIGKLISAETALLKAFDMSREDFEAEIDKIKEELDEGNIFNLIYQMNQSEDSY